MIEYPTGENPGKNGIKYYGCQQTDKSYSCGSDVATDTQSGTWVLNYSSPDAYNFNCTVRTSPTAKATDPKGDDPTLGQWFSTNASTGVNNWNELGYCGGNKDICGQCPESCTWVTSK